MNQDRQGYEYHLTLLSVRMRVKFPCKMKVQHQGNLLTAEIPSANNENRFVFNQQLAIRNQYTQTQCFEFVLHLLTDKGARYIGGVAKLYHSELIRSQGEKLALSLTKCVDSEAFCEIRVNKVVSLKDSRIAPYDRKSSVQRHVPSFRPKQQAELSPFRNTLHVPNQQSRSEYNFPVYQSSQKQEEWDNRTKMRYPPPANHSRIKTPSKYTPEPVRFMEESEAYVSRDRAIESEVYKQGYQKLKQKYKKQSEINKQELNKRLALENNQNNLKLELMRLRMRLEEQDKAINEKTSKIKQYQNSFTALKQKEGENNYLLEQLKQKEAAIEAQSISIASLTADLTQMRQMTRNRNTEESYKVRELRVEVDNLKVKLQNKDKELQHQAKARKEIAAEKEHEIALKQEQLDRNKKIINDLEKGIQTKNYDLQKMLQNDRSNNKNKIEQLKTKVDKLEREALSFSDQKRQLNKKMEELKAYSIKIQYEKKLLHQQYDSLQEDSSDYKNLKEKVSQLMRENKNINEERSQLQLQVQKIAQSKEEDVITLTQQLKQQSEHFRAIIKELEEKERKRSTQIAQIESQLQQAKSQLQKQRKTIDGLNKDVEQCKERQKNAKKAVKNKQQESLGIETEHATLKQKLKTIDQIYKLQADKIREESDKYRTQHQQSTRRLAEMQTRYDQLHQQHGKIKNRLQYVEQQSDRDSVALKDKQTQMANYTKETQEQIIDLEKAIATLRASEKQMTNKLQRIEVDTMRKDERAQKTKRDLRVFEEKCNNFEFSIKSKNTEIESLTNEKQVTQAKLTQKQAELNQLKADYLIIEAEKNKLTKISELVEENLKKSKEETTRYLRIIEQKQQKQTELLNIAKNEKEEYAKLQFNHSTLKKQYDRNKQTLYQNIQKYIFPLVQVKDEEQQKSSEKSSPKKIKQLNFAQISNLLVTYGKQLKQMIQKINDQNKQLQKQKQRLHQTSTTLTTRSQDMQASLNAHIAQLQEELHQLYEAKECEKNNFTIIINELNEKIKEKEYMEEQLNTQIEQLNFTINSIRLDSQALNEQNTKRMAALRKINLQWEQKAQNLLQTISEMQDKNLQLLEEIEILQIQLMGERQQAMKRQKAILDYKAMQLDSQSTIDSLRRKNKEIMQNLSDCELYLASQRQMSQKIKESLQNQQRASTQLKAFVSELMRQKEASIKNDLQKNESITNLEATFLQQSKNNELLQEDNERLNKNLQVQKQSNKKYAALTKQLQQELREQKSNHIKAQQKLRQKDKQLTNKQDLMKRLEQRCQKITQKLTAEMKHLTSQLQQQKQANYKILKENNERIVALQGQIQRKNSQLSSIDQKANHFEQQLFELNEKHLKLEQVANTYQAENEQLKSKINILDGNLNQLSDEIKERQQKLFEYSGRNYTLELKLQSKENQHKLKIDELSTAWNIKFNTIYEEYEQRIDIAEKEREYFRSLSEQRDKEVVKAINSLRSAENTDSLARKAFEQKSRKQQEQKLAIIAAKNIEIQKYSEEIRSISDNVKAKESELRRAFNELEIAKKTITNFDIKLRQSDEKVKSMVRIYQAEIDQLKKKDSSNKLFKESISNHQWNCERETKKNIQSFIRNFLEINEDKNSQKVIELARSLQNAILQAVSFNFVQK